jgi:hypothetical protein
MGREITRVTPVPQAVLLSSTFGVKRCTVASHSSVRVWQFIFKRLAVHNSYSEPGFPLGWRAPQAPLSSPAMALCFHLSSVAAYTPNSCETIRTGALSGRKKSRYRAILELLSVSCHFIASCPLDYRCRSQ